MKKFLNYLFAALLFLLMIPQAFASEEVGPSGGPAPGYSGMIGWKDGSGKIQPSTYAVPMPMGDQGAVTTLSFYQTTAAAITFSLAANFVPKTVCVGLLNVGGTITTFTSSLNGFDSHLGTGTLKSIVTLTAAPQLDSAAVVDLGWDSFDINTTTLTLGTGSGVSIFVRFTR